MSHIPLPLSSQDDWWAANDGWVRSAPLAAGLTAGAAILANRALSGVSPIASAASGQSRADVLALALTATLLLTGLQWRATKGRAPPTVELEGRDAYYVHPGLPKEAAEEVRWLWWALASATRCGSLVITWRGARLLQAGLAPEGEAGRAGPEAPPQGPLVAEAQRTGQGNYLANLVLFPGRVEFAYLPANAQGVLVQPVGAEGALVLATGTQRGFTALDQAWVALLADKLEGTLSAAGGVALQLPGAGAEAATQRRTAT